VLLLYNTLKTAATSRTKSGYSFWHIIQRNWCR